MTSSESKEIIKVLCKRKPKYEYYKRKDKEWHKKECNCSCYER